LEREYTVENPRIGLVVPANGGDAGWLDGAWNAWEAWRSAGLDPHVVVGAVDESVDSWDIVVLHGIQYLEDATRLADGRRTIILSDVPTEYAADPAAFTTPSGVTMIDWCWWRGAEHAGRAAAQEVGGPLGFVAGPPVPTQQRAAAGFVRGVAAVDPARRVNVLYLSSFLAMDEGLSAGKVLVENLGCELVAHSADAPGSAATAVARGLGAATYGFLTPVGDDTASLRSAITPVLCALVSTVLEGGALPDVYVCSWEAGEICLER